MNDTRRTLYQNALLIALSDGQLDPEERDFLSRLAERLDIDPGEAKAWLGELRHDMTFRPVSDPQQARQVLTLAVGVVAADGELDRRERHALFSLAKSMDCSHEELASIYQSTWGNDAVATVFGRSRQVEVDQVIVLADHFEAIDNFAKVSAPIRLTRFTLEQLKTLEVTAPCCVFHSTPEKVDSLELLARLKRGLDVPHYILIASRHHAPQISYLREAGAARCIVEPIYPGELATVLADLGIP